ncbi:MAG: uracil phosphoribosyltransferase [Planctomycetes bacterium]|nr:uracil phosphoribosyltransferase [Planctomycetota bacterium]
MELSHGYGPRLHILDEAALLSILARLGSPETSTAEVPHLVRAAYARLLHAVLDARFPTEEARLPTRMTATEPRAFYQGRVLCRRTRLVICAVVRAGILPAQTCYELACQLLPPENVRIDYLNLSRETDAAGHVTGVRMEGSKIGGDVDDAVLLVPDPMGATGGTVCRAVEVYRAFSLRPPRAVVALHLMCTPEATLRVLEGSPETEIWCGRFDRGLSPDEVLRTPPGTHPQRERGLNDVQYVVPGAGGLGELLTNSWV